jgi:dipeptidyl-peptidase-4
MKLNFSSIFAAALTLVVLCFSLESRGQKPTTDRPRALEVIVNDRDRMALEPRDFQWSPSGDTLSFIRTVQEPSRAHRTPVLEICSLDAATGQESVLVSPADLTNIFGHEPPRLPEEEEEDTLPRTQMLGYSWANNGRSLLIYTRSALGWFDASLHSGHLILRSQDDLSEPEVSPDGRYASFVRNHTLWVASITSGAMHPVSRAGAVNLREGEPDWLYRHELKLQAAYWWAPDSSAIAWMEFDDRAADKYTLHKSNGPEQSIAFPKPGSPIPIAHLKIRSVKTATTSSAEIGAWKNVYIPLVRWLPDSRHIAIERLSRDQKTLDLLVSDAATGASRIVLTERDAYWINLEDDLRFVDSNRFLWSSEKSGFRHLFLYDINGQQLSQLTRGNWEITSVAGLNTSKSEGYFTATEASVLERQLYGINLDGSGFRRLTQTRGTHHPQLSPDGKRFLDVFSNHTTAPVFNILSVDGAITSRIAAGQSPSIDDTTEYLTFKTHVGEQLHASITRPVDFNPAKKYPVIFFVAGGPDEQVVRDMWGGDVGLWLKSMTSLGYVVFSVDNHGTSGRGHLFEEPVHLRFASQEMADIRDAVIYLDSLPWVDQARIGICGFGFGGFLTLHGMLDKPILFKAGFAGEPVSDWHFYDVFFTERYLEAPDRNQDGWLASSPLDNAKNLNAPLMVAQATLDETYHIENSLSLLDELLDKGKYADILLFPDRHDLFEDRGSRTILFQRMTDFFLKNL